MLCYAMLCLQRNAMQNGRRRRSLISSVGGYLLFFSKPFHPQQVFPFLPFTFTFPFHFHLHPPSSINVSSETGLVRTGSIYCLSSLELGRVVCFALVCFGWSVRLEWRLAMVIRWFFFPMFLVILPYRWQGLWDGMRMAGDGFAWSGFACLG